jgi:tRNA G18 (ribose-2'-O)-methylase SpoU
MEKRDITLVVDNVRSLENVGSMFRTADGAGVREILLVGISGYPDMGEKDSRRPYLRLKQHKALAKTALSGIQTPFRYFATRQECLDYIASQNLSVVVLEQNERSVPYDSDFDVKYPCCVVVGNELEGVASEFIDVADVVIDIPMLGRGVSLNVSVSAGIILYRLLSR